MAKTTGRIAGLSKAFRGLVGLYVLATVFSTVAAAPRPVPAPQGADSVTVATINPSACAQIAPATSALLAKSPAGAFH